MQTLVYIVRHCQAEGNVKRVFQGYTDADITQTGEMQLERLSERFADIEFDVIYSSDLIRAQKTAFAANRNHGVSINLREDLREINVGDFEGVMFSKMKSVSVEQTRNWDNEPHKFCPPGGESMEHVYNRAWNAVCDIVAENVGKTIVIVSHGCFIRNLLCRVLYNDITKLSLVDWSDNTAVSLIEFNDDLKSFVVFQNDNSHIPPYMSTLANQKWWQKKSVLGVHAKEGKQG